MKQNTAEQIDREAAAWAAKHDRDNLTTTESVEFRQWLESDPRALGAYGRIRAVDLHMHRARALSSERLWAQFQPSAGAALPSRRRLFTGMAAAASVAAVSLGVFYTQQARELNTRKGEIRSVALEDGSVLILNSQTHIQISLKDTLRKVSVLAGEVLFQIAKDTRPFVVSVGTARIVSEAATFCVRKLDRAPLEILVDAGKLSLNPAPKSAKAIPLAASTHTVVSDQAVLRADNLGQADIERNLAWRNGQIIFDGEPLDEAIRAFSRYSDTRIVVEAPAFRQERIAGMFRATDPIGFAQAVAVSLNGHVTFGDNTVFIRPGSAA